MSIEAMAKVCDVQVPGIEKSVLVCLATDWAGGGDDPLQLYMPPVERIAQRTCWSVAQVEAALESLRRSRHLVVLSAAQGLYRMMPDPA